MENDKVAVIIENAVNKILSDNNNIDIAIEDLNMGNLIFRNNVELSSNKEKIYFIEIYLSIEEKEFEEYSKYLECSIEELQEVIKSKFLLIIYKVFNRNEELSEFSPNLKDTKIFFGVESGYFYFQIETTAKLKK